jgi:hypothetical protein
MSYTYRVEAPRGEVDDQVVADALNASLAGEARVTPRSVPPGSLTSIDPNVQSFIIEVLNSRALETIFEPTFAYFIARGAPKVKVGDIHESPGGGLLLAHLGRGARIRRTLCRIPDIHVVGSLVKIRQYDALLFV